MNIINVSALKALVSNREVLDKLMVVVLMGGSATAGYYIAKRQLDADYDMRLEAEIAATKKYYGMHVASYKEYGSPEEAVKALVDADDEDPEKSIAKYHAVKIMREEGYETPSEPDPEMVEVVKNVFTNAELDLDVAAEDRSPEYPYVITFDEFYESDYESQALTYYAGDEVLADEAQKLIPDVDGIVGETNLERFGHGSKDSRIVYVRNERLEVDFEISLADGKYSEEILGFNHEDKHTPRRFRETDD